MPGAEQARRYLHGAWLLFRFDARGVDYLDPSVEGFWESFWCAGLIAPLYVVLLVLRSIGADQAQAVGDAVAEQPFWRIAAVETITYVVGWVAFPLVMAHLVRVLDRAQRYFVYFTAYNWCNAPQLVLMAAVSAARASGLFPGVAVDVLEIASLLYALGVLWFLARAVLDVSRGTAALIVVIDFLLNQLIYGVGRMMLR
ncbi:MAG: hypothetical protein IT563_12800 [Alphaproteobacteria bacterium]|nr:hypothetical protein [Alphaproteobacteria bacterium]